MEITEIVWFDRPVFTAERVVWVDSPMFGQDFEYTISSTPDSRGHVQLKPHNFTGGGSGIDDAHTSALRDV